jgi:fumarate hydratase subunit beta
VLTLVTPLKDADISKLKIYDHLEITGYIYTGRDVVLPRLIKLWAKNDFKNYDFNLQGSVIFHTAVSPAGIGPTSSNKIEIESSIPGLSAAGVKVHLGKGALNKETIVSLKKHGAIFAVTPPVSALLTSKIISSRVVAFAEEGIEAMYELKVENLPAIVAIAQGESIFS